MDFKARFGSGMKKINTYGSAQAVKFDNDYRSDGTINSVNTYSDEYLNNIPDYNTVLEEVGQLAGNANNGSGYIDDDYFVSLGASSYHSSDSSNGVINLSEAENAIFYSQEQYLNYCENLKKQREYLNGEIRFIENQFMFSRDASNDVYGQFIGHEYADEDNWIEKEITYAYKDKNGQYVTTTETFKFYNGIWANVDGSTGYYSPPDQICSRSNPLENTSYIEEFCKKNGLVWGPGTKELNAFYEYIDGEYTDMFNEYLINKCGVSYDVYKQYQHDVLTIDSYEYALRQKAKVAPFNAIAVTDEYKRYVDAYVNDGKFSSVQQRNKLTDDELVMYTYLFDTRGEGAAKEYINAMEDTINQRIALAQSTNFDNFASVSNWLVSDKDGNINYASTAANLSKLFPSLGIKGFGDGIESFGEGLKNVFAADGVISANSYEQMYIIQALTGSSSTYINELAKEITDEQKLKEFASNIYDKNGNINWTYANSVLDSTQFNVLRNKVSQDQIGADVLSHVYNISTSIGNMAIPVAISTIISIVAPQVGVASVATAATIGEWTGTVLMGLSAGGNSGNQVLIDGGTLTQAWEYGLVSGLSEACLEKIGGIMGIGNASGGFIKSMFSEGREEFIQEYLDAGFQSLILGKEFNFKDTSYAAFQSFCYGALSAGVMNGATGAVYGAIKMTMPNGEVLSLQECMEKYGDMSKEQYESIMGKTGFNIPVLASQYALDNNMTLAQAKFAVTFGLSPDVMSAIIQTSQANNCSLSTAYVMNMHNVDLEQAKYVVDGLKNNEMGLLTENINDIITYYINYNMNLKTVQGVYTFIKDYMIQDSNGNIIYDINTLRSKLSDGVLSQDQVAAVFKNLLGEQLSSWIPKNESASNLFINLLSACNNAGIRLENLGTECSVLNLVEGYYAKARALTGVNKGHIFNTYRTHGVIHVVDVLTQSINAYATFKNAGIGNLSLDAVMLSAIMHDTGMAGGQLLRLSVDENGRIVINTVDIAEGGNLGKHYRESHSFNSGVDILSEFENLRKMGYTDLQIAEASLLAFAHSKSNSGLNPLTKNVAGWSFAIQALAKATEGSNFDIIGVLKQNGIIKSDNTVTEQVEVKFPEATTDNGKISGNIEAYDLDANWILNMAYEALIVRIGDALTNNDNAGTNQYGKPITFKTTDYSKQININDIYGLLGDDTVLTSDKINSIVQFFEKKIFDGDNPKNDAKDKRKIAKKVEKLRKNLNNLNGKEISSYERFEILSQYLEELAKYEAANVTYEVNGSIDSGSQQYILGENNQTYRIEVDKSSGNVDVVVSLKKSDAVPFCTLFAITERMGELTSKGTSIFNGIEGVDALKMELIIEVDKNASSDVKEFYNSYAKLCEGGSVEVQIREIATNA